MFTGRAWWGARPLVRVGFAAGALLGGWRFARRKGWGEILEKVWGVKVVDDAIVRGGLGRSMARNLGLDFFLGFVCMGFAGRFVEP